MKQLILAIDIQKEFITEGRQYHIRGIEPSLINAKKIISHARKNNIPLWFMQHQQDNRCFIKNDPLSALIDGFEPKENELLFTKSMYSCFSSNEFSEKLAEANPEEIIIIGYGSSMCCLCTTIEGIHRGYRFTLIEDATASANFPHANEEEMHRSAYHILRQYAKVIKTADLFT